MAGVAELERLLVLLSLGEWPDDLALLQLADQVGAWAAEAGDSRSHLVAESVDALRRATSARADGRPFAVQFLTARLFLASAVAVNGG
jgi:hypothetical protein